MDKQKQQQTGELIAIIQGAVGGCATYWASVIAEEILKYYQPKIPEGALVLTKEEYEALTSDLDKTDYGDFENGYSQGYKQGSTETAEKFAPLRKYMWDRFHHYHDIRNKAEADYKKSKDENGKAVLNNDYHRADAIMFILGKVLIEFDEIFKENTEGK